MMPFVRKSAKNARIFTENEQTQYTMRVIIVYLLLFRQYHDWKNDNSMNVGQCPICYEEIRNELFFATEMLPQ